MSVDLPKSKHMRAKKGRQKNGSVPSHETALTVTQFKLESLRE